MATILQRLALADRVSLRPAPESSVSGFDDDTLVRRALEDLARATRHAGGWRVELEKRIPIASGLGGGSSDAATALRLANPTLARPLGAAELHALAADLGADVPFFLSPGPQLALGDGTRLSPLDLPQDYWVVLVLPHDERKQSTGAVYERFDARDGAVGYGERRAELDRALAGVRRARSLATLPANDLASSPLALELRSRGAFRADVNGAGPTVYGLFLHRTHAEAARRSLAGRGRTWLTVPAWYF